MKSMTGFGQASGGNDRHEARVAIRSVNGRYLDVNLRMKEEYRHLETRLRRLVEARLDRGRVDLTVDIRPRQALEATVDVQMEVVRALHAASHQLLAKGLVASELSVGDLLRLPEVLRVRVEEDELWESDRELLDEVTGRALDELIAARAQEGGHLAEALDGLVSELGEAVELLGEQVAGVREGLRRALRERLEELLSGAAVDEDRLEQEVAVLVDKSDVTEEVDRLATHLEHYREVMGQGGPVGKRLDFLTQEILRELNTVGAKARDATVTRTVLDAKILCEQLREQLQNIE